MGVVCSCHGRLAKVGDLSTHPTAGANVLRKKTILTPNTESAVEKLKQFYDEERKFIPKKIDVYYQSVISAQHREVTSIVVKLSRLGPRGIEYLCRILPFYSSILELRLWKVGLDPASTNRMSYYLAFLTNLTVLSLEDNNITDPAVDHICKEFKTMKALRQIWLGCNLLTAMGAGYIASSLRLLPQLETLSLDYNDIGATGCSLLCTVLCETHRLQSLSLEANAITSECLPELKCLALGNSPEHKVNLRNNKLSKEACAKLTEVFGRERVDVSFQL